MKVIEELADILNVREDAVYKRLKKLKIKPRIVSKEFVLTEEEFALVIEDDKKRKAVEKEKEKRKFECKL